MQCFSGWCHSWNGITTLLSWARAEQGKVICFNKFRHAADKITKIGYVAPWPLPEVIRLGNAFMLGVKQTCTECTMEVRWINTWYDPDKEKQAAQSLLDAGVDIVLIGSDTPGPLVAASNAGKWGITYDFVHACAPASSRSQGR